MRAILSNTGLTSNKCVPSITSLTNVTANNGSIPDVAPAIIDIVPVGAIVVTVAFLVVLMSFVFKLLLSKLGKLPLSSASLLLAFLASSFRNFMSFSANSIALSES